MAEVAEEDDQRANDDQGVPTPPADDFRAFIRASNERVISQVKLILHREMEANREALARFLATLTAPRGRSAPSKPKK
jgi:hypothetical protein